MLTALYNDVLDAQGQLILVVDGGIQQKFLLIQASLAVHVTCKNDADPPRISAIECSQHFFYYKTV